MFYKACIGFIGISLVIAHSGSAKDGRQVWRIVPSNDEEVRKIKNIGDVLQLDFWNDPSTPGRPVDFLLEKTKTPEVSALLQKRGLSKFEIVIEDVEKLIKDQQTEHSSTRSASIRDVNDFDYSVYHKADEIYAWMDTVENQFPDVATKKQFGVTFEGRPIYVLEFKRTSTSRVKPMIFVDALIHCREWISTASLLYIFKEMLLNEAYSHMLDEADWYFIPMINIDGYVKTWEEDRLWRKTVRPGAISDCPGVDANRNFDSMWSMPGASSNPCSAVYYGPTAASESEVRNLADYVLGFGFGNISAYVTVHSYSQLILYPYGFTEEPIPEYDYLDETSRKIHDAMKSVHGKEYTYGPSSTTIYVTSGTTQDWAYDKAGVTLSYTFELRDNGQYGFLLPADQIIPQGEEFLAGLAALKNVVVENF